MYTVVSEMSSAYPMYHPFSHTVMYSSFTSTGDVTVREAADVAVVLDFRMTKASSLDGKLMDLSRWVASLVSSCKRQILGIFSVIFLVMLGAHLTL